MKLNARLTAEQIKSWNETFNDMLVTSYKDRNRDDELSVQTIHVINTIFKFKDDGDFDKLIYNLNKLNKFEWDKSKQVEFNETLNKEQIEKWEKVFMETIKTIDTHSGATFSIHSGLIAHSLLNFKDDGDFDKLLYVWETLANQLRLNG